MIDTVNNNTPKHRFELEVEGHLAAAYYERSGNVITFEHTEVPAELGGKGVGSRLVKGALDQVRAEGLQAIRNARSSKPGSARTRPMPICSNLEGRSLPYASRQAAASFRLVAALQGRIHAPK